MIKILSNLKRDFGNVPIMFVHLVSKPEGLSSNNYIEIKTSKYGTKLGKKEITFTENVNEGRVQDGFHEH